MYTGHAWLAEVCSEDVVHFGNAVFTFEPFVPFVDLPGLVSRATWDTQFKWNVAPEHEDGLVEQDACQSPMPADTDGVTCDKTVLPCDKTVLPCDNAVLSDVDDDTVRDGALSGRKRYNARQTHILEACYSQDPKPTYLRRKKLSTETGLIYAQVTTWFNNRRKREVFSRGFATRKEGHAIRQMGRAGHSNRVSDSCRLK
jgi:hypothetical protein